MPYPPTSVSIRAICGRLFSARGSVSSVLICGRLFSARSFCEFRAFCGNIFSPTYFTDLHSCTLWAGSVGMAGMPYPPNLCSSVSSVGGSSLQEVLCILCVLWESLSSHGFHRFTQILRVRCSPTEFTEYTEFGSVGMAGMPYPPTSVRIRAICGRLFSARGSVYSVHSVGASSPLVLLVQFLLWQAAKPSGDSCTPWVGSVGMAGMPYPPTSVRIRAICGRLFSARGSVYSVHSVGVSSPLVRLVQQRLLHPLAESTEVVCKSHPFTSNPAFCMSSQYCGYDFVTTCGSLMRSPGNTIAAGANAIAMRWSS